MRRGVGDGMFFADVVMVFVGWGLCLLWPGAAAVFLLWFLGYDEPESLILAQSERWRHA